MPALGADMTEGTITRWLIQPGDHVSRGDVVAEIETDKADMEVEVFESGVVAAILVPQGERVAVGTPLALIEASLPATPPATPPPASAPAPAARQPEARATAASAGQPSKGPRTVHGGATPAAAALADRLGIATASIAGSGVAGIVTRRDIERAAAARGRGNGSAHGQEATATGLRASPRARRLMREAGIDASTVAGTGPGGAVRSADLAGPRGGAADAARAEQPAPAGRPYLRGPIAALMARANREIPHYYLGLDIDMGGVLAWLERENAKRAVSTRLLPAALLIKAVALAARDVPEMNGHWRDDRFHPAAEVNVAVAISLRGGGLVAPAIMDAASKPADTVMAELRDLVLRARQGRLRASEMSAGTVTVTNLGDLGVDFVYGVIYPPQVALVGFGRVSERPWADAGMLGVRPIVTATLAADHRASDGHRGGQFLAAVQRYLQEPTTL